MMIHFLPYAEPVKRAKKANNEAWLLADWTVCLPKLCRPHAVTCMPPEWLVEPTMHAVHCMVGSTKPQ
jgi:hypothetical protein